MDPFSYLVLETQIVFLHIALLTSKYLFRKTVSTILIQIEDSVFNIVVNSIRFGFGFGVKGIQSIQSMVSNSVDLVY